MKIFSCFGSRNVYHQLKHRVFESPEIKEEVKFFSFGIILLNQLTVVTRGS
jgi:hypothetical protein